MRKLVIVILLTFISFASDKLYFMPEDGKAFKSDLIEHLENAKSSIKVAMYNFEDKKLARVLQKKARSGLHVIVYYYKKDVDFYKKIDVIQVKRRKLHTKMAIIDDEIVVFGSANWTKKSFKKNYEMNYITDNEKIVSQSVKFFENIKE